MKNTDFAAALQKELEAEYTATKNALNVFPNHFSITNHTQNL
ncbi:hypothetical protein [Dyadobacter sp. NIV53]|nr:hypothetical protein [Dyadobacter sp. NIV53]